MPRESQKMLVLGQKLSKTENMHTPVLVNVDQPLMSD